MIVLDASAAVELVVGLPAASRVQAVIEEAKWRIHAPQLLIVEVLQVLRRRVAAGITTDDRADEARELLNDVAVTYHDHEMLAERIWMLRQNVTAYDAAYLALAEALDAPVVTTDAKLARAPGHPARVVLVE